MGTRSARSHLAEVGPDARDATPAGLRAKMAPEASKGLRRGLAAPLSTALAARFRLLLGAAALTLPCATLHLSSASGTATSRWYPRADGAGHH